MGKHTFGARTMRGLAHKVVDAGIIIVPDSPLVSVFSNEVGYAYDSYGRAPVTMKDIFAFEKAYFSASKRKLGDYLEIVKKLSQL